MNKMDLLKALAPGFLPLIIFILADSIWGTRIGLIVLLGVISIIFENDIFFKLKPALIELLFCVILGISVFSPINIMMMISRRYMKNISLSETQQKQFTRNLRALFYIFIFHTLLIIYSAFFMSKGVWAFVSGGLFYILFAVYFVYEFFRARRKQPDWNELYKDDEWFDIVDIEGRIIGKAPRSICHSGPGLLHPVVHLHIIDDKDRIFLQKRSLSKQIQPGKWDTSVGGHIASGEKIEDGLKREAAEELGITTFDARFLGHYKWETDIESELVFSFISRYNKVITINKDEIDEGKFWKIKKIKESLGKNLFTPNFEYEFNLLLKNFFKQE